jgi:zinc transporter
MQPVVPQIDQIEPFDAEGGLLFATRLPGSAADFEERKRGWGELDAPAEPPPLWVHLDRTRSRAQRWLREESGLPETIVESLLTEETRPRMQMVGKGLLVILRGVHLVPGLDPDVLISIRLWIEPARIIALRQFWFKKILELREEATRGEAPKTPGEFLSSLALGICLDMAPTAENLEEMLDEIEDGLADGNGADTSKRSLLATIRRQAISYRRYLVPQRDMLMALSVMPCPLLSDHDHLELRSAAEHVARIAEALEEIRDRAAVTQDELRARQEAKTGRTLYVLTIVATIAMPLTLITGLLGTNVGGIPWRDSAWGFASVCGVVAIVALLEFLLVRHMKWL